jgi:hypothetical protein
MGEIATTVIPYMQYFSQSRYQTVPFSNLFPFFNTSSRKSDAPYFLCW